MYQLHAYEALYKLNASFSRPFYHMLVREQPGGEPGFMARGLSHKVRHLTILFPKAAQLGRSSVPTRAWQLFTVHVISPPSTFLYGLAICTSLPLLLPSPLPPSLPTPIPQVASFLCFLSLLFPTACHLPCGMFVLVPLSSFRADANHQQVLWLVLMSCCCSGLGVALPVLSFEAQDGSWDLTFFSFLQISINFSNP